LIWTIVQEEKKKMMQEKKKKMKKNKMIEQLRKANHVTNMI